MRALQIIPDRFAQTASELEEASSRHSSRAPQMGRNHVRRMTRGIVLKDDTFATLRVVTGGNQPVKIVDAGGRRGPDDDGFDYLHIGNKRATDVYSNFLLQQVQEERIEKQQIIETFGEPYIFLFGERARILSFSGILANTFDFNWEAEWWHNYENYLRGTKCVENDARVYLSFDTTLVGGYIIASTASKMAQERNWVQFQFQLFVTSYANFSEIGNPRAVPIENGIARNDDIVTDEEAKLYRPTLITDEYGPPFVLQSSMRVDVNGRPVDQNLLDAGGQSLIDTLSGVWNKAGQIVDSVVSNVSSLLNGELVRVPVGFAGTLAYDEDANVQIRDVKFGGRIQYSTFDQNDDEYVGQGDHYLSARSPVGDLGLSDPFPSEAAIKSVEDVWRSFGVLIPSSQLGPVTSLLAKGITGLAAVGASRAWTQFNASGALSQIGSDLNSRVLGINDVSQATGIHFPE